MSMLGLTYMVLLLTGPVAAAAGTATGLVTVQDLPVPRH